ncbi:uncharacterized protein LOC111673880 [Orussus abietinus]|uniref:uncharacterized protein LOC111673880 n=1 Tax=Orussus abietinus TaxID=222816 RepID=UPI000C716324|nr:uncharacterized protein LOC111673880 [Orussus abietinus]
MKNNSSTLIRLYYVGKVIGLCPYDLDEVNMPKYSCYGVVYGMILSMVYTFLSYNVILERFELIYPYQFPLKIIADIVFLFVAFLATIASWMVFAFGQTQFRTLVASFNDIDDRMEELGILEDKRRLIKRFVRDVTVVNVSFYVLVTGEQVFLLRNPTYNIKVWLPFTAFKTVVYMTLVIFINLLLVLRDRFRALNERILILERVTIVGAKSWMHSYCVRSDMGVERIR